MLFPMVHDKGGLGGSICMYSVISKTNVLFVREVRVLGICWSVCRSPKSREKVRDFSVWQYYFSRANIFRY
jgi:hypothetical protein